MIAERRKVKPEDRARARELTVNKIRGVDTSQSEDPWKSVREELLVYISEIQQRFDGRVIKRNEKSVRFDGKPLNEALRPLKQIVATCRLNSQEISILEQELDVIVNK